MQLYATYQSMQYLLNHEYLPYATAVIVILGCINLLFTLILYSLGYISKGYNYALRHWTPKGWYHSMVLLISDMARGGDWQELHLPKVLALLEGLKKHNYRLYVRLYKSLPSPSAPSPSQLRKNAEKN